jgi:hypothetical protein
MSVSMPPSQYTGLSTDDKPIPVDAVVGTRYEEIDTHVIYFWTGSKWKTWEQLYKEGRWTGIDPILSSSGIFEGKVASSGTFTTMYHITNGVHQKADTGGTIDTFAGIKSGFFTFSEMNPYIRFVFILDQITDCNFYCGLSGLTAQVGNGSGVGDNADPYPISHSIGLKLANNETNFKLYTNAGNSPGTTEVTPIAPADTQRHTFEIRALYSIPKYQYKIDDAVAWTDVITDIPGTGSEMGFQFWIQNRVASSKTFRLIDIYTRVANQG